MHPRSKPFTMDAKIHPFECYVPTESLQSLLDKPRQGLTEKQKLPVMTFNEVVVHNQPDDCWVVIAGTVRDLTPLIQKYQQTEPELVKPIIAHAGKDISHWFHPRTLDIVHYIHPITGVRVPYTPHGRVPHTWIHVPSPEWQALEMTPWWLDSSYVVGHLTKSTRPIRIMNTISRDEVKIHVCSEDTINRILERYLPFNRHARSYTWKFEKKLLDMNLTLEENGIPDERKLFSEIHLPVNCYVPCLMLYFNDDLTESNGFAVCDPEN